MRMYEIATSPIGTPLERGPARLRSGHVGLGSAAASPAGQVLASQKSFAAALGKAQDAGPASGLSDEDRAREAAEQLVTQTFLLPLLKQLRETDGAAPPFAATQAEKQFRALGDADLAQRIVHAARFPLVDRLARDLLKKAGKDVTNKTVMDELAAAKKIHALQSKGVTIGARSE
jgi:hypothetical protein